MTALAAPHLRFRVDWSAVVVLRSSSVTLWLMLVVIFLVFDFISFVFEFISFVFDFNVINGMTTLSWLLYLFQ